MSRPGIKPQKHDPQYTTLIETADAASIEWWRSLTPVERGQVISAVAPQDGERHPERVKCEERNG